MVTRAKRNTCHRQKEGGGEKREDGKYGGKNCPHGIYSTIRCDNLAISMPSYYLWVNDKAARSNPVCHDELPQE